MEEQLEQSKRRLHFCMALIGGWFGAYAILRFHHFASAVTVNFIEVFTSAVQEQLDQSAAAYGNRYPVCFYDFSGSLSVETL